ncbi:MAG: MltA domain-containing protein [Desulfobacteraceae bacterium]|nr:MltA domain-containing protein [Desulfobacteraceae bacterium]
MSSMIRLLLLFILLLFVSCAPKPITRDNALKRLSASDYPDFNDSRAYDQLSRGIEMSLRFLRKLPADQAVVFGPDTYPVAHLIRSLEVFAALIAENPTPEALNRQLRERFVVYAAAGGAETHSVLFTGYYTPVLKGRRDPSPAFPVAIHSRPTDLVEIDLSLFAEDLKGRHIVGRIVNRTVTPYPDRQAIDELPDFDRLAPPIAWVKDQVDLFNLMVQGSGKVDLENGQMLTVQFDGSNGRPYRSIGRMLIDEGKVSAERMSMQAIREYLRQHPDEAQTVMNYNPRYIFFKLADDGPIGALGVPLTALRSIAVDRAFFPQAALAFIQVPVPMVDENGAITEFAPMSGFCLTQDTGSAITGPGRVDLFWGGSLGAEVAAGHLKKEGRLYFLVLKPDVVDGLSK